MSATNPPLLFGGITQPFTFQGLSSFFLRPPPPRHGRCPAHIPARPSCRPTASGTISQSPGAARCSTAGPVSPPHRHLFSVHRHGCSGGVQAPPRNLLPRTFSLHGLSCACPPSGLC